MNAKSIFTAVLLLALLSSFCILIMVWETASASQEQTGKQTILAELRTLIEQNEALTSLIKMDFTIEKKTSILESLKTYSGADSRVGTGNLYTHMYGTWAQDDIKQYSNYDWYSADGHEKGYISIVDGEVRMLANKPDLMQVGINQISEFDWYMVPSARLGNRFKDGRYRLSELLVPEYASIHDGTESIQGHETWIVDVRIPVDDPYFRRIWIDRKRGMPLRIELYKSDNTSKPGESIREIKDIRLHQLPNGGWIPLKGVSSLYWRPSSNVSTEHIVVDINSITTRREDIPDSLFTLDIPEGARVTNRITGINYIKTELAGKSLPDFNNIKIDFSPEQVKDKKILVCFWDMEQRPSRNCIKQLSKRAQELKSKNVEIIAIHASNIEQEILNEWIEENNISFPIGMIEAEEEKIRFNWGVKSLPWLILTDKNHIVRKEGISVEDINELIK